MTESRGWRGRIDATGVSWRWGSVAERSPTRPAPLAWSVRLRTGGLRSCPLPLRRRLALLPVEMSIDVITTVALAIGRVRVGSVTY